MGPEPRWDIQQTEEGSIWVKKAGLEWNMTLSNHITWRTPWKQCKFDDCLLLAKDENTRRIGIIAVYVDDILITGSWEDEIQSLQNHLLSRFDGRIDPDPETFLGLEIKKCGSD